MFDSPRNFIENLGRISGVDVSQALLDRVRVRLGLNWSGLNAVGSGVGTSEMATSQVDFRTSILNAVIIQALNESLLICA